MSKSRTSAAVGSHTPPRLYSDCTCLLSSREFRSVGPLVSKDCEFAHFAWRCRLTSSRVTSELEPLRRRRRAPPPRRALTLVAGLRPSLFAMHTDSPGTPTHQGRAVHRFQHWLSRSSPSLPVSSSRRLSRCRRERMTAAVPRLLLQSIQPSSEPSPTHSSAYTNPSSLSMMGSQLPQE